VYGLLAREPVNATCTVKQDCRSRLCVGQTSSAAVQGYCTTTCDDDEDCPGGMTCRKLGYADLLSLGREDEPDRLYCGR